jgi:hypothetical protein
MDEGVSDGSAVCARLEALGAPRSARRGVEPQDPVVGGDEGSSNPFGKPNGGSVK